MIRKIKRFCNINTLYLTLLTISILYIITSFTPSLKSDDNVSMGMITHSYSQIINIDATDVHPPLYYMVLKCLIDIFTFWTKSLFVKVICARIISFIFLISSFLIMFKILNRTYKINIKWQILIYLLIPGIVSKLVKIRMYTLSSLFIVMELYELISYTHKKNNFNLILATIFASFASYCFYPSAISAGLFILLYLIYFILKHEKGVKNLFISGIALIALYIPWIKIAILQFINHSKNNVRDFNHNSFISIIMTLTQVNAPIFPNKYISLLVVVFSFFLVIIFIYISIYIIKHLNNKGIKYLFIIVLSNLIVTMFLMLIICKKHYETASVYPIFSIFSFILVYLLIYYFSSYNRLNKVIIFIMLILLSIYSLGGLYTNVKINDTSSIDLVKNVKSWKHINNKNIILTSKNPLKCTQDALYLKSIDKDAIIKNVNKKTLANNVFNDYNYVPVGKLFNNMHVDK